MDGFEINKVLCAVLVALLVGVVAAQVSNFFIKPIYLTQNAYPIEGAEDEAAAGATNHQGAGGAAGTADLKPIEPLLAAADPTNGQGIAKKCLQCHSFESGGPNKVGPNLWNVLGGPLGHISSYTYSKALSAMKEKGTTWTYENLNHFLHRPGSFIQGTKMAFAGIAKEKDRADLIAYLRTLSDNPKPLPNQK